MPGAQPSISNAEGDILFLLDSSGSVSYYEFSKVKEFMWDLVQPFSFGPRDVQTSIIHISTTPTMEFPFDRYQSRDGVQQAIRDTRQLMGDTNTGQALSYAKEKFFSNEAGARPEVPKVLVWVTDGFSTDDISEPMQLLKDMGVTVFIVSTGRGNYLELSAAASQPPEKHLHFVDVDDLPIITKELQDAMLGTAGLGCAPWESAAGAGGVRAPQIISPSDPQKHGKPRMKAVCLGRIWPCPQPRVQARCWHAARHPAPAYEWLAVSAPSPPAIRGAGCCYQHYDCSTGMFLLRHSPVGTCSASASCAAQRRNSQPSSLGSAGQQLSAASTAVAAQRARSGSTAAFFFSSPRVLKGMG